MLGCSIRPNNNNIRRILKLLSDHLVVFFFFCLGNCEAIRNNENLLTFCYFASYFSYFTYLAGNKMKIDFSLAKVCYSYAVCYSYESGKQLYFGNVLA